jgi:hypothetical protein
LRLFFDNNISKATAEGIAAFVRSRGIEAVHLTPRFPADTPDAEWIAAIQAEDWTIISGDPRIARNPVNRAAWRESRLTAFFMGDGFASKSFWPQTLELVRWMPLILDKARSCPRGAGFLCPLKGSQFNQIYDPSDE